MDDLLLPGFKFFDHAVKGDHQTINLAFDAHGMADGAEVTAADFFSGPFQPHQGFDNLAVHQKGAHDKQNQDQPRGRQGPAHAVTG